MRATTSTCVDGGEEGLRGRQRAHDDAPYEPAQDDEGRGKAYAVRPYERPRCTNIPAGRRI